MYKLRKSSERGYVDHGWLKAKHSFSFASYYDPEYMGFYTLRVINQDVVAPGGGFATHPHKDMEIITYILRGVLEHRDSMGNVAQIKRGEIQVMSAGTGVTHSEYNPSGTEELELLQIWIQPEQKGVQPQYQQRSIDFDAGMNKFTLLVSPNGEEGSLSIHQRAYVYFAVLSAGIKLEHTVNVNNGNWIQIVRGKVQLNGMELFAGDGIGLIDEEAISLVAQLESELLLFELPPSN